jgi:putative transposase
LREQQVSAATYYRWKQKYGGMNVQDAKKLKELEVENTKLKRILAEAILANDALKEFISKKV